MKSRRNSTNGISDMLATVLTLAITIISGASVFSFVNAQSSASAQSYGQNVGTYIEQMKEMHAIL